MRLLLTLGLKSTAVAGLEMKPPQPGFTSSIERDGISSSPTLVFTAEHSLLSSTEEILLPGAKLRLNGAQVVLDQSSLRTWYFAENQSALPSGPHEGAAPSPAPLTLNGFLERNSDGKCTQVSRRQTEGTSSTRHTPHTHTHMTWETVICSLLSLQLVHLFNCSDCV